MSIPASSGAVTKSLLLVPERTFLGLAWTCVAVSFIFLIFRLYVRLRVFRRLFDDDALLILGWLILLTTAILWLVQQTLHLIYISYDVYYNGLTPPAFFAEHVTEYVHLLYAQMFLSLCGLYCVKFSFLAFFRRLGYHVRGQKILWWSVFAATVAGFAISTGVIYYPCAFSSIEWIATMCNQPAAGSAIRTSYRTQVGCDVATDFLIMTIPIHLLWRVKINLRQKIALISIFSLTFITIIFAIVRVEVALRGWREDDSWFYLCSTIELTIAILVACLVSYRSWFTREHNPSTKKAYPVGYDSGTALRGNGAGQGSNYTEATAAKSGSGGSESSSMVRERGEVMPLDMIRVRNDYMVSSQV